MNKKNIWCFSVIAFFVAGGFLLPSLLLAAGDITQQTGLQDAAVAGGLATSGNVYSIIGNIIRYVLGLVGAIFLILVIVGGIQWMTSAGNEEAVKSAKQKIVNAVIGLAIVLAAYGITTFVVDRLHYVTDNTSNPTTDTATTTTPG